MIKINKYEMRDEQQKKAQGKGWPFDNDTKENLAVNDRGTK